MISDEQDLEETTENEGRGLKLVSWRKQDGNCYRETGEGLAAGTKAGDD